mgnify:CR=1 FL=1
MKSFLTLNQELNQELNESVQFDPEYTATGDQGVSKEYRNSKVGWFSNKYNRAAGWILTKLSPDDVKFIKSQGMSTKGILRSWSDQGNTSFIKVTEKGTYAFADNDHLTDTDELKFDKPVRMLKFIYNDKSIF